MTKTLKSIYIYVAITAVVANMHHPVTPRFISDLGIGRWIFGYMLSSMALGSMMSSRLWGIVWDKHKSKLWILLPFSIGYAITIFGLSQSTTPQTIILFRFLSGPFAGGLLFTLLPALIAHESNQAEITKNQMIYLGTFGLFSPVGYFVGGTLGNFLGASNTILVQSILITLSIIPGWFLIPNGRVTQKPRETFESTHPTLMECVCMNFRKYKLHYFLILVVPFFMIKTPAGKFFDVLLISEGFTTMTLGTIVMFMGIITTFFLFIIGPKLMAKFNEITLIGSLLFLISILLIFGSLSKNIYIFIGAFTISLIFIQIVQSLISSFLVQRFPHKKGEVLGIQKAVNDIGLITGPILLGLIFAGYKWLTFTVMGVLLIPPTIIFLIFKRWLWENIGEVH